MVADQNDICSWGTTSNANKPFEASRVSQIWNLLAVFHYRRLMSLLVLSHLLEVQIIGNHKMKQHEDETLTTTSPTNHDHGVSLPTLDGLPPSQPRRLGCH